MKMLNLYEYLKKINNYYSPDIIDLVNDLYVKLAKIKGDKVLQHTHEEELFI